MSQLTSILWKDTRELLPELVVSAAILGLFLFVEPSGWASSPFTLLSASMLSRVVAVLVVVSWGVLIVRLVQAERLVGLNQFWTTRPYEWSKLFGAKAVFIALFIWLPLVCSHLYLLKCANLAIWGNLHLLLINLVIVSIAFLLPFACVAALTGTFSRAILVIVGVVVLFTASLTLGLSPRNFIPADLLPFQIILLGLGLLFAVLNQYRSRNTCRSGAIVLLTFGLGVLTQVFVPGSRLSVAGYERGGARTDLTICLDSDPTRAVGKLLTDPAGKKVTLHLPLLVVDPQSDQRYHREAARLTLTSADGFVWKSSWLSDGGLFSSRSQMAASATDAEFSISPSVYRKFRKGPVSVSLEFATRELTKLKDQTYIASLSGARIPRLGSCAVDETLSTLICHSAYHQPGFFSVVTERSSDPCTVVSAGQHAYGSLGEIEVQVPFPKISPVEVTRLQHTAPIPAPNLCPGTPMVLSEWQAGPLLRFTVPPMSMQLSEYARIDKF